MGRMRRALALANLAENELLVSSYRYGYAQ